MNRRNFFSLALLPLFVPFFRWIPKLRRKLTYEEFLVITSKVQDEHYRTATQRAPYRFVVSRQLMKDMESAQRMIRRKS